MGEFHPLPQPADTIGNTEMQDKFIPIQSPMFLGYMVIFPSYAKDRANKNQKAPIPTSLSITSMFISESLDKVIFFHPRQGDKSGSFSQSVEKLLMATFPEDVPVAILIPG